MHQLTAAVLFICPASCTSPTHHICRIAVSSTATNSYKQLQTTAIITVHSHSNCLRLNCRVDIFRKAVRTVARPAGRDTSRPAGGHGSSVL